MGADRSQKRTDTDTGSSQVVDLVDLQAGIDLSAVGQDLIYLVGGHCVKAAAEGIELDQVQILLRLHKVGCRVQPGVVHPLVIDTQRAFQRSQVGDGIFRQHTQTVGIDHIRDSVMDFRVNVVRPSCQDDAAASRFFHIAKGLFAFF